MALVELPRMDLQVLLPLYDLPRRTRWGVFAPTHRRGGKQEIFHIYIHCKYIYIYRYAIYIYLHISYIIYTYIYLEPK